MPNLTIYLRTCEGCLNFTYSFELTFVASTKLVRLKLSHIPVSQSYPPPPSEMFN